MSIDHKIFQSKIFAQQNLLKLITDIILKKDQEYVFNSNLIEVFYLRHQLINEKMVFCKDLYDKPLDVILVEFKDLLLKEKELYSLIESNFNPDIECDEHRLKFFKNLFLVLIWKRDHENFNLTISKVLECANSITKLKQLTENSSIPKEIILPLYKCIPGFKYNSFNANQLKIAQEQLENITFSVSRFFNWDKTDLTQEQDLFFGLKDKDLMFIDQPLFTSLFITKTKEFSEIPNIPIITNDICFNYLISYGNYSQIKKYTDVKMKFDGLNDHKLRYDICYYKNAKLYSILLGFLSYQRDCKILNIEDVLENNKVIDLQFMLGLIKEIEDKLNSTSNIKKDLIRILMTIPNYTTNKSKYLKYINYALFDYQNYVKNKMKYET